MTLSDLKGRISGHYHFVVNRHRMRRCPRPDHARGILIILAATTAYNFFGDIMTRYKIQYRGKEYTYTADDAEGAISKFCDRPVFGSPLAFSYRVLMIDADTQGWEWCRAEINFGGRDPRFAIIDAVREDCQS